MEENKKLEQQRQAEIRRAADQQAQKQILLEPRLQRSVEKHYGKIENLQELKSGKGYIAVTRDTKQPHYNVVKMDRHDSGDFTLKAKTGYQEKEKALSKSKTLNNYDQTKKLGTTLSVAAARMAVGGTGLER
jgi:hypothetical protein